MLFFSNFFEIIMIIIIIIIIIMIIIIITIIITFIINCVTRSLHFQASHILSIALFAAVSYSHVT